VTDQRGGAAGLAVDALEPVEGTVGATAATLGPAMAPSPLTTARRLTSGAGGALSRPGSAGSNPGSRAAGEHLKSGLGSGRGRPWLGRAIFACLALAGLSLLLPSTPSYDPWAWIVWGREVAALDLDTRFGPSWKPLPVMLTTPFSLLGDAAPELWLAVARAGALLGLVAAFRLARRLGGTPAGVLAAAGLALSGGYLRGSAIGYSEGMLVALVLLAVERHLDGRRRQALALGFAAGLLRPETWPFLGLYALYVFVRDPRARLLATGLMGLLPVLWLGPELWGAGDPLRAASRAQDPTLFSPAFADRPALAVLDRAQGFVPWPVKLGTLAAVVLGAVAAPGERPAGGGTRRSGARARATVLLGGTGPARVTLALAGAAAAWLALVALMTELGYAGNSRYLAVPIALFCVVGGVGLGWIGREGIGLQAGRLPRLALALVLTAAFAALSIPAATELEGDAREVVSEARLDADLSEAVARAGGRERVLACGRPYATALQVPAVAWQLGLPTGQVGIEPRAPGVLFRGPSALQPPDAPAPPPTAGGFRPIARVGGWTVSARCP
jgi:hypothetical protein